MAIERESFGTLSSGEAVDLYTLRAGDFSASWTDYGATWTSLMAPDRKGKRDDVLLGFPTLDGYARGPNPYFGATVGRWANRIGGKGFDLGGKSYRLWAKEGLAHLHGGRRGFDKKLWTAEASELEGDPAVRFSLSSPDGDEGYPGRLDVLLTVSLSPSGLVGLDYQAKTDAPTPLNLTNHAYFNLGGEGSGTILGHLLRLESDAYLAVDALQIPLPGRPWRVQGTPFDFRREKTIGSDIEAAGGGYDHCFLLAEGEGCKPFALVREPRSGRCMKVATDLPGVQFYTGNNLADLQGKGCSVYQKHSGFCLETEFYPDSPNRPDFPACIVQPGQTWHYRTTYEFGLAGDQDA